MEYPEYDDGSSAFRARQQLREEMSVGSEAFALRCGLSDRFKYGYVGFCCKTKRGVRYTVDNVLRCGGCSHFVSSRRWRELGV